MECTVDPAMELTAVTHAHWYGAPAPLFCGPTSTYPFTGFWDHLWEFPWGYDGEFVYEGQLAGRFDHSTPYPNRNGRVDVEGCCFWGRGVIQTTGVCNFGKLNYYLGARTQEDGRHALYPDVDFCQRPDKICASEYPELKWVAGLFYWMESVEKYSVGGWSYFDQLRQFVDGGELDQAAARNFIDAVSGIVNRGCHNPPCEAGHVHAAAERAANFQRVLQAMQLV